MSSNSEDISVAKTIIMGILIFIGMIFFFCYKVEACKSGPEVCRDTLLANVHDAHCPVDATMQTLSGGGYICHCPGHQFITDAGN